MKGVISMKTVALVPIKLNSQRLPHKNILPLAGRPLCWHISNTLVNTKGINEVYIYCSDDKILQYLPDKVIFKKRDKCLDEDSVKGFDIYRSFIDEVDADVYVLAHTTSPFIRTVSIENALEHVLSGHNDSAFSAEKIQTFAWYQGKSLNYNVNDVPRTQDIDPIWKETSAFFIFKKEIFTKYNRRIGFTPFIQEVSGMEAIDIDEKKDYEFALKMAEGVVN